MNYAKFQTGNIIIKPKKIVKNTFKPYFDDGLIKFKDDVTTLENGKLTIRVTLFSENNKVLYLFGKETFDKCPLNLSKKINILDKEYNINYINKICFIDLKDKIDNLNLPLELEISAEDID